MKIYRLILLVAAPLLMCSLSFGPRAGESPRGDPKAGSVRPKPAMKMYSKEVLKKDLSEIKSIHVTNHPAPDYPVHHRGFTRRPGPCEGFCSETLWGKGLGTS